jgi:glyoxylase-like metal-dependent hydrolase (beta-lactamase superfamily II)
MDQLTLAELKQTHSADEKKAYFHVAPGVWGMKTIFVNLYMVATADNWVLIDAGMKGYGKEVIAMAEDIFGEEARPSAIILTHGHLDHVGTLHELLAVWDTPVYAHRLEMPYLTGMSSYPPADPAVGGGLMALSSFVFSPEPIDLGNKIHMLDEGHSVPGLPGWEWIHTPGHSPGHISLWRREDRLLIAGDAFVTTKQESAFSVMTQLKKLSGPPKYFTMDWEEAYYSVKKLAELEPEIAATGHGKPMHGTELRKALHQLADNFYDIALPKQGRYRNVPARANEEGVTYLPPLNVMQLVMTGFYAAAATAFSITLGVGVFRSLRKGKVG